MLPCYPILYGTLREFYFLIRLFCVFAFLLPPLLEGRFLWSFLMSCTSLLYSNDGPSCGTNSDAVASREKSSLNLSLYGWFLVLLIKSITSHKQLLILFDIRCFFRMKVLWWRHPWFDDLEWIFCFDALYCNRIYVITLILLRYFVWQITPLHFMTGKIVRRPLNCRQFGNTLRSFISFSLCCLDLVNHHIN